MPKESTKPKTLAEVLKDAKKKYSLSIGPMSQIAEDAIAVSTGNLAIDNIIGVNGIPLGRSVELYGLPSSGKTTTALQVAATLQATIKAGGDPSRGIGPSDKIVYFDYEQSMDVNYAKALGLDVDDDSFLFAQPDSLEQGANLAIEMIGTGEVRMVIWDSVAAMNPEAALDADVGASLPAIQARVFGQFMRQLNGILAENNCASVFVNHLREKMQMGGFSRPGMPPATTTPGGVALKFYASVRIEFTQIGSVKGKVYDPLGNEMVERVIATNVRVKVVKNKLGAPFKQAVVRVRYGRGFDNFWTALQLLVAHKKVTYTSGYWYFEKSPELVIPEMPTQSTGNHRPYIRGEESVFEFADEHPDWRGDVITAAAKVIADLDNGVDAVTPVISETEEDAPDPVEPTLTVSQLDELFPKPEGRVELTELTEPLDEPS